MKKQFLILTFLFFCAYQSNAQYRFWGLSGTNAQGSTLFGSNSVIVGTATSNAANNVIIGESTGNANTTGTGNVFVGQGTATSNTSGYANAFFGTWTGTACSTGFANTFLGQYCGIATTSGAHNTFAGQGSGNDNISGSHNVFMGTNAGVGNFTGNSNIAIGGDAGFFYGNLENATAIGANTIAKASNTIILGPLSSTTATNTRVGIGTDNPAAHLHTQNDDHETVVFETTTATSSSILNLRAPGPSAVPYDLRLERYGNSHGGSLLNASGTAPAIPFLNLSGLFSEGRLAIGMTNEKSGSIHFVNYVNDLGGNPRYSECMRINETNGFVGIHTRQDNVSPGTGDPTALFHVNLTNPINSGLDPETQGIRFQGLPQKDHPYVVLIDGDGNLAYDDYSAVGSIDWHVTGNNTGGTEWIGTTLGTFDDFRIRTNGTQRARFTHDGNFDLGIVGLPANSISSNISAAMGTSNMIDGGNTVLAVGTTNTITNTDYSVATGTGNNIDNSGNSFASGKDNIVSGVTNSAAIGEANQISGGTTNVFAAGAYNTVTGIVGNNTYGLGVIGMGNIVQNSDESFVGGEENTMIDGHGTFIGGGHNTTDGAYNFVGGSYNTADGSGNVLLGNSILADGAINMIIGLACTSIGNRHVLIGNKLLADVGSSTAIGPDLNPAPDASIMIIGDHLNSNLSRSLSTGFDGNRTTVTTKDGLAVQLNPLSGTTYQPTVNFEVDASVAIPSPGPQPLMGPAASNIRFHNLPPDPQGRMLPAVLIDPATGELFQSQNTYQKPGKGDSGAGMDSMYKENEALKKRVAELESKLAVVPELQSQLAMYDEKFAQLEKSLNQICESGCAGLDNKHSDVLYQSIPNPTDNNAKINYFLARNYSEASIVLYSMDGREVGTYTLNPAKGDGSVDVTLGDVSPGTYLYRLIVDGNPVAVKKIQKQ